MTYTITEQCIACENCLPYCSPGAITKNSNGQLSIDANLCDDCLSSYGVAQCRASCPTVNGCMPTLSSLLQASCTTTNTYWESWFVTYERLTAKLKATQETQYWQRWFNLYSQKLDLLLHS